MGDVGEAVLLEKEGIVRSAGGGFLLPPRGIMTLPRQQRARDIGEGQSDMISVEEIQEY